MGASEELRQILDSRGIEYKTAEFSDGVYSTWFDIDDEREFGFDEFDDGVTVTRLWRLTPMQAVTAALGRGDLERENAELLEMLTEARDELAGMYEYMDGGYAWPSIEDDPSFGPFYKRLCDRISELGMDE